jgi:hypothetical protein
LNPHEFWTEQAEANRALSAWTRGGLVAIALGLVVVFAIAIWLDPYDAQGQPRRMETHRQLGMPPCTFYTLTGLPCPSCGMTTSFALLVRGDVINSLRANAVGTLLALFWLALIPWSLVTALRGRLVWIRSLERALTRTLIVFMTLLLLRWAVVLAWNWRSVKALDIWPSGKPARSANSFLTEERRWHVSGTPGGWPPWS